MDIEQENFVGYMQALMDTSKDALDEIVRAKQSEYDALSTEEQETELGQAVEIELDALIDAQQALDDVVNSLDVAKGSQ